MDRPEDEFVPSLEWPDRETDPPDVPDADTRARSLKDRTVQPPAPPPLLPALLSQVESTNRALVTLADELRLLRDEVQHLKRRIGVRARARLKLEDEQLQTIADAMQAKLGASALDDNEFDRIVDAIVRRLESMLEVVPSDAPPTPTPTPPPAPTPEPAPARSSGEKRRTRGTQ